MSRMSTCPVCGYEFPPRHRLHTYDCDHCRRVAGWRRHGVSARVYRHPPKRRPKAVGTCRWCHQTIWAEDGHTDPREYCDLKCRSAARAAHADEASMARFLDMISHPQPPAPTREYRVIDGLTVEVVWSGSSKRSLLE